MTDIVVRQPNEIERLGTDQIKYLASTEFVPQQYRGKLPEIMACIATGRELGLGDMESLRLIDVVDGRPALRAEAMVKLARRRGHSITADYGEGRVTVNGKRVDNGDVMSVTWTLSMAKRAGLDQKTSWRRYPEAMLWARAVSQLCRMLFPDVLGGVSQTPDEVELTPDERVQEITDIAVSDDDQPYEVVEPPEVGPAPLGAEPSVEEHEKAKAARRRARETGE
jgi:hypothetical protein